MIICDVCRKNEIRKKYHVFERHGRKFRFAIQIETTNGPWGHLWKNADVCDDCLDNCRGFPGVIFKTRSPKKH